MKAFKRVFISCLCCTFFCLSGCNSSNNENIEETHNDNNVEESYTIIWKNFDGNILETDVNVRAGVMPNYNGAEPVRDNDLEYSYTWSGWTPEVELASSDKIYTATFDKHKIKTEYTINFDLNGGTSSSFSGSKTVESFSKDIFFFDLVKEEWNFRGWSYNGTKIFDEKGNQLANPTMSKTMTFVAIYAQTAKMTIFTNLEGAGNITGEDEYPYNTYVDVSAYAKQGYEFVGWYYQNTLLSNTNEYKYMMWSEDVTLEARFKLISFLLNVHTNNQDYGLVLLKSTNNNNYLSEYQCYCDYSLPVTIAAYSKTNIRFLGWYDNENKLVETNAVYNFTMPNHDYILEAKWNHFTINYVMNGGINDPYNPTSFTIDLNKIDLYAPNRYGYNFTGWTYNGKTVTEIDPSWADNITLVANWSVQTYSIVYELNGGTNNSSNPTSYTVESDTIILHNAARDNYTFAGWYTTSNFSHELTEINKGTYGNLVLYAKWMPVQFSIIYDLKGGTNAVNNPSSYTVESSFAFDCPTRIGYTFLGWFDSSGNQVTSISAGTSGVLILTAHWNEGNAYTATLDTSGGTVSDTAINVQYDHSYSLPTPTKNGYTFDGWFDGTTKIDDFGTWTFSTDKVFIAHWKAIPYTITYILNGGVNNALNPYRYTIEDNVTFEEPTKTGYEFLGWYINDIETCEIEAGNTGNLNVVAKWTAAKNELIVVSEDEEKGTVIFNGSGFSDETITATAYPNSDCMFRGWFNMSTKISENRTYTFNMPKNDYTLIARFYSKDEIEKYALKPTICEEENTITYGMYPQSLVSDSALITKLNNIKKAEDNGWYLYENDYFAKTIASPCANSNHFTDGTKIIEGTTYWFKCEPIVWKILRNTGNSCMVISNNLLDSQRYYSSTSSRIENQTGISANNYLRSDIYTWLKNEFYNSAFSLNKDKIQTTSVDNSPSTTDNGKNNYTCGYTQDKVFLPSYREYIFEYYGFSTSETAFCKLRRSAPTDWARARGAYYSSNGCGRYWTRSPYSQVSYQAWMISEDGQMFAANVNNDNYGVRPAITVSII